MTSAASCSHLPFRCARSRRTAALPRRAPRCTLASSRPMALSSFTSSWPRGRPTIQSACNSATTAARPSHFSPPGTDPACARRWPRSLHSTICRVGQSTAQAQADGSNGLVSRAILPPRQSARAVNRSRPRLPSPACRCATPKFQPAFRHGLGEHQPDRRRHLAEGGQRPQFLPQKRTGTRSRLVTASRSNGCFSEAGGAAHLRQVLPRSGNLLRAKIQCGAPAGGAGDLGREAARPWSTRRFSGDQAVAAVGLCLGGWIVQPGVYYAGIVANAVRTPEVFVPGGEKWLGLAAVVALLQAVELSCAAMMK